jgi:hypothetical protein
MAQIAARLSPEDIGAVSSWLAAQPVPMHSAAPVESKIRLPLPCGGVDAPAGSASGPVR